MPANSARQGSREAPRSLQSGFLVGKQSILAEEKTRGGAITPPSPRSRLLFFVFVQDQLDFFTATRCVIWRHETCFTFEICRVQNQGHLLHFPKRPFDLIRVGRAFS